jgi:hypothetical protein
MTYGFAAHGEWCGARTYPTRCRYCGGKVFYFECRCGSKVFFAELGGEWPEHRCMQLLVATYGKDFVQRGMALQMKKHVASNLRTPIEKRYEQAVRRHLAGRKKADSCWTRRVDATANAIVKETAVIRDVHRSIDVAAKLRLGAGQMTHAMLGRLGKGKFGQITFHCGDLYGSFVESYTAFIEAKTLDKLRLEKGDLISIAARAVKIASKGFAWLCEEIEFTPKDYRPSLS